MKAQGHTLALFYLMTKLLQITFKLVRRDYAKDFALQSEFGLRTIVLAPNIL
jgi:hypothetical protein